MPSFNRVILLGTLTRDPELKYTPKGTAIAEIGMALNRTYKADNGEKREEVCFVDVTLWGRTAEIAVEYCKKGSPLHVEGHLSLDQWDDKQTGQKRSKLKVVGENIQLLGSKPKDEAPKHPSAPHQRPQGRPQPPRDPDLDPPEDRDKLPF